MVEGEPIKVTDFKRRRFVDVPKGRGESPQMRSRRKDYSKKGSLTTVLCLLFEFHLFKFFLNCFHTRPSSPSDPSYTYRVRTISSRQW